MSQHLTPFPVDTIWKTKSLITVAPGLQATRSNYPIDLTCISVSRRARLQIQFRCNTRMPFFFRND